jgi:thiosulfate/3-mercaptopyruvate sulfurtransferase
MAVPLTPPRAANPLVTAARLRELLQSEAPLTVLDVRWSLHGTDRAAHDAGHVPGAWFVDLETDLADPPGVGGRHPLPAADRFAARMRAAGVSRHVPVVVLDQRDGTAAARLWWMLRLHGHPDVRVLDGGFDAWVAGGGPVSTDPTPLKPGDFVAADSPVKVIDAQGAAVLARTGLLLDARSAQRYAGSEEQVDPVAGHVPGARSAPTSDNVGPDGRLLPPEVLRERFSGLGLRDGVEVGAYCGSGITAAHQVLALEVAGFEAALYAGSWSDWITDPRRPVAIGSELG